jgi:hypothetical protein
MPRIYDGSDDKKKAAEKPETALNGLQNAALNAKQESAALALASGCTQDQAARKSGAGVRTIKTWLQTQPAFVHRIRELRGELTARSLGKLVNRMSGAADTLGFLCRNGKSEMVRLSAVKAILELGAKLRESVELEERIAALENKPLAERKVG